MRTSRSRAVMRGRLDAARGSPALYLSAAGGAATSDPGRCAVPSRTRFWGERGSSAPCLREVLLFAQASSTSERSMMSTEARVKVAMAAQIVHLCSLLLHEQFPVRLVGLLLQNVQGQQHQERASRWIPRRTNSWARRWQNVRRGWRARSQSSVGLEGEFSGCGLELEEDDCILERLLDTLWRSLTEVVRWKGVGRLLGRGRGRSR